MNLYHNSDVLYVKDLLIPFKVFQPVRLIRPTILSEYLHDDMMGNLYPEIPMTIKPFLPAAIFMARHTGSSVFAEHTKDAVKLCVCRLLQLRGHLHYNHRGKL